MKLTRIKRTSDTSSHQTLMKLLRITPRWNSLTHVNRKLNLSSLWKGPKTHLSIKNQRKFSEQRINDTSSHHKLSICRLVSQTERDETRSASEAADVKRETQWRNQHCLPFTWTTENLSISYPSDIIKEQIWTWHKANLFNYCAKVINWIKHRTEKSCSKFLFPVLLPLASMNDIHIFIENYHKF